MTEATEVALEMGIDPVFCSRRVIRRKKKADESATEEVVRSREEEFRVHTFYMLWIRHHLHLLLGSNNFKYMRVHLASCLMLRS